MQRLTRWGNSTGIRLPRSVLEAAGLKVGDYCYVRTLDSGELRIRPVRGAVPACDANDGVPEPAPATAAEVNAKW